MPGFPLPGPSGGYRMAGVLRTARTRPGTACDQGVDQGVHWREEPDEAGLWMGIRDEPRTVASMHEMTSGGADVR